MKDIKDTIKYIELDNDGNVRRIIGICVAKDFKKNRIGKWIKKVKNEKR